MNLVIVTPGSIHSAIARSTNLVVNNLKKLGHSVQIIRSESEDKLGDPSFPFATNALIWIHLHKVESLLENIDLIIYQIGDCYEYHAGCIHLIQNNPGLVVLHDFFLVNLLSSYCQKNITSLKSYLNKWYDKNLTHNFFLLHGGDHIPFYTFASQHTPMTEIIADKATGVITHSLWGIERVLDACAGPVACIPLAYNAPLAKSTAKMISHHKNKKILLTFGHINSNKRTKEIIQAIGENNLLKEKFIYRLTGPIEDEEKNTLQAFADKYSICVEFTGRLSDEALAQEIAHADIVSCLRYPVMEAFSASTIEAMLYGKIIMVTDTSFYKDFPNDCVIKVPLDDEINAIQILLENFLKKPKQFQHYGVCAKKWASKTFDMDVYAQKLIAIAKHVLVCNPVSAVIQTMGDELLRWGINTASPILDATVKPLYPVFSIYPDESENVKGENQ